MSGEPSPSDSVSLAVRVRFSLTGGVGGVGDLYSRSATAWERTGRGIEEVKRDFF